MSSSSRAFLTAPNPWTALVGSLVILVTVDALLFHLPFYSRLLEPQSYAGRVQLVLEHVSRASPDPRLKALVMGDSRCAEGFSEKLANEVTGSHFHYQSAALVGSTPRLWYYLLRRLLATGQEYSFVIVSLDSFLDLDSGENFGARMDDLRALAPLLKFTDIPRFVWSYPAPQQPEVALSLVLKGLAFKLDLLAFLKAPVARFESLRLWHEHFSMWQLGYPGREGTMTGLHYLPDKKEFLFMDPVPPEFMEQAKRRLEDSFSPQHGFRHEYRQEWLSSIAFLLSRHSTTLVFVRMPRHPAFPENPIRAVAPSTVEELSSLPNVVVLPESTFAPLDRQELFFDTVHLNREGRRLFTLALVDAILKTREGREEPLLE